MKFIALCAVLISFNSFAATKTKLQKTFDGGLAKCMDEVDVGSRAYNLEIASETITNNQREIILNVNFYKCDEVVSGYGLRPSSPDEVLHSFLLLPNGKMSMTNNKLTSGSFAALDTNGFILSSSKVLENGGKFQVKLSINKDVKKVFIEATLISDITSEIGNLSGVENKYGGFVLNF